ncbi:MDR family MFS transporter [Bacillus marinisedimentorum]|uniref:MDR family MFS transporter n=1 Tax=Bacillus marinisedimentorum TaxID=1821260 RepID=UPI0008722323|nr:MDR family MFS transporter [Bacillus marinisedimentorum]
MSLILEKIQADRGTHRPLVLAAIMLAMFMAAIEATIVSTAMPNIVADLGGFALYSWVFSAYLLFQAATVLIYGKMSDLFGRKPVFVVGVTIFLAGSILAGFASSMKMLIVFRLIQGFGAGAVMPIASTIVGDIYTKEERAKIQGYLSSVWGISAIMGPALGGFFVQYATWRLVFWINVPLGILSILGVVLFLHEGVEKRKHTIDYAGSVFLVIAITSLMVILVEGGVRIAWGSWPAVFLISAFLIGFILFIVQERRAEEPMMPFDIWKYRSITVANLTSLTTGVILIGISSFLPAYVQGVMERSPIVAGFTLTTMSIGWPISATIAGRLLLKIGFRKTSLIGGFALVAGSLFFILLSPDKGPVWAGIGSFFIGVGMGMSTTSFIVSIQSTVSWRMRGIATASNMFMRTLGSTIGAALLGGILNSRLQSHIQQSGVDYDVSLDTANILLNEEQRASLPGQVRAVLQEGLTGALHNVYLWVAAFAVISLILIAFMPKVENE